MVKLEELSISQKRTYSLLKSLHHSWEEAKIGMIIETRGSRSISADYQIGNIVLYKKISLKSEQLCIGREVSGEIGSINTEVPESYVEEITEN
ncbi:MAG: hypothetical protein ABIH28_02660 [archaeon]